MKKISIAHMNNKHNDWLRAFDFYKQEVSIIKLRLTEIAGKNTSAEVAKQVESFENQCIVQTDNMDRLYHDITENIAEAGRQAKKSGAGYIDAELVTKHDVLEQAFIVEEKTINTLRHEFSHFASTWM